MVWAWAAAFATGLAVVYGLNIKIDMEPLSDGLAAFYGGCHRAAWALALGWLIFACCRGYGGNFLQLFLTHCLKITKNVSYYNIASAAIFLFF